MKKKRPPTAEEEVARVQRDIIRAGLRRTMREKGPEYSPLWVRSDDGNTWRIERQYGGDPAFLIQLDQLPGNVGPMVAKLLELLDEQSWMARITKTIAAEPMERDARIVETSKGGGRATAEKYARPELDDLICGCLQRGDKTRDYTKEWADQFNVSRDTIYRAIKRIKLELAKT